MKPAAAILVILATSALVGTLAYVGSTAGGEQWTAESLLRYRVPAPEFSVAGASVGPNTDERILAADAAEAGSLDNAVAVARRLRVGLDDVRDRVTVTGDRAADIVTVSGSGDSRSAAADLANTYARTVVERTRQRTGARARRLRQAIKEQIEIIRGQPAASDGSTSVVPLRQDLARVLSVQLTGAGGPEVVQTAVPTQASAPPSTRNGLFGLLFGAALGAAFVVYAGRSRRRSHAD